jgi:hypothetical protein
MTVIWLIVWLIGGAPDVASWGQWNSWAIALFVCLAIDLVGALGGNTRRAHRPRGVGCGPAGEYHAAIGRQVAEGLAGQPLD